MNQALLRAISYYGSQASLARAIGVSAMSVSLWLKNGLPVSRAIEIESATGGEITREELLPEIFRKQSVS